MSEKLQNIGPKSAAWLRQVGVRSLEDLKRLGAVGAFLKVKKAGFRPSLNLLYALAGAELGCHWTALAPEHKSAMVEEVTAAEVSAKAAKNFVTPARDVTPQRENDGGAEATMTMPSMFDDPAGGDDESSTAGADAGSGGDSSAD